MRAEVPRPILDAARRGEPAAVRAVYEHHADRIFSFLRRMLGETAGAEDAVQETFMRALPALRRFDPEGPAQLSTWLFTIARRVALTLLARRPAPSVDPQTSRAQTAAAPGRPELRLDLEAAIAALPEAQRAVFLLAEGEGLSYEDIARVEELDLGTVKSRLHRARLALREALAEAPAAARPDKTPATEEPDEGDSTHALGARS